MQTLYSAGSYYIAAHEGRRVHTNLVEFIPVLSGVRVTVHMCPGPLSQVRSHEHIP